MPPLFHTCKWPSYDPVKHSSPLYSTESKIVLACFQKLPRLEFRVLFETVQNVICFSPQVASSLSFFQESAVINSLPPLLLLRKVPPFVFTSNITTWMKWNLLIYGYILLHGCHPFQRLPACPPTWKSSDRRRLSISTPGNGTIAALCWNSKRRCSVCGPTTHHYNNNNNNK